MIKALTRKFLPALFILFLFFGMSAPAGASGLYGRDGYGLCDYARDCPTTPTSTTTKTTPTGSAATTISPEAPSSTTPLTAIDLHAAPQTKVLPAKLRLPDLLAFIFPWLLFILLGLTLSRLTYLAWQEKRLKEALDRQILEEKTLNEEKTGFLNLSSHYLRTPVATISNGIDLLTSTSQNPAAIQSMKSLAHEISTSTNDLLQASTARASGSVIATPSAPTYGPLIKPQPLTAGFVKVASLPFITFALFGSLIVIAVADVIVNKANIYDVKLVDLLIQLALTLLLGVMLYSTFHTFQRRKVLREQAEQLLRSQRDLDASRDELVKRSLSALREPLGRLKSQLEPLATSNPQAAKPTMEGVRNLEALLQKFVILTSLESGTMARTTQPIDTNNLVSQIADRFNWILTQKGISVKNEVKPAQISQDPLLMTFVLESLLSNAIKYSPEHSEISIHSSARGNMIQLEVKDNGPGITQQKLTELLQPFSRAEDISADFNQEGAGLSLYLDKLILKYLGGGITLNSSPGAGTLASISLPAKV